MLDFKRIGGEIVSSPLNENFRRLRNDISISNMNLVFSETDGIKDTITDMLSIESPENAQACYVISSGELYRYATHDNQWHKIADFGQTFRQGFLNSGAVVLEAAISLKADSTTILSMPNMLVYFKNKPGDKRYLKGMYLIEAAEVDITPFVTGANAYSISVDENGNYFIESGMPSTDNPNKIYLGTFLSNDNKEIIPQFIYTIPDVAYTADRGQFLLGGGQVAGMALVLDTNSDTTFDREGGYYYDEGINYTQGLTDNYPVDSDNGSNFNIKYFEPKSKVSMIYMTPKNGLSNILEETNSVIYNKYWDGTKIAELEKDYYTIQHHLVTPNGQSIMLYGDKAYNSITDAISHINDNYNLDLDFPYVETTRIVVGNVDNFSVNNAGHCAIFLLKQLIQAGTVSPEFADNLFKIYDGDGDDTTPASIRFDLDKLKAENYDKEYNLVVAPSRVTRDKFSLSSKYFADNDILELPASDISITEERTSIGGGYQLADNQDLEYLKTRVSNIEKEIWSVLDSSKEERYDQSIRYRLFQAEKRLDEIDETLEAYGERITYVEKNKVHKGTTVNGYTLGDNTANNETKVIDIKTGDIGEGAGNNTSVNQWFTQERVRETDWVTESNKHYNTKSAADNAASHTKVNPHNLSTDDINYLTGTDKLFVTVEEERRIRADKLPDDTIQALADLDAKNMDSVKIDKLDGNGMNSTGTITQLGNITGIRFYEDGLNLEVTEDGETLIVECKGQVDEDMVMLRQLYASQEMLDPENPELIGTVNKAIIATSANSITGIEASGADKYYGTDAEGIPGIYDIQKFVTTTSADSFTEIDQIAFIPIDKSVLESHLSDDLANKINNNYHQVYNTGVLSSAQINTFNFGDNLTVSVEGSTATINAVAPGSSAVTNFANLADVNVSYTGNAGKALVINEAGTGVVVSDAPSMDGYMLKTVYVDATDITKVKKAVKADTATLATTASNALKLSSKTVDDSKTTDAVLWTASKIISNTSSQITKEGVTTHSGTSVPSNSLGKNGDIYILIEN